MAVGLANLIGQHRMRHPGEAVFVAGPESISITSNASPRRSLSV
ncbi:hypothetical protein I553_2358 [Mycobacterium xenopi 4042]|uniref:Uncharacterized protein n=1 Tax=Mycobacterium xenopi 4042 TaxID=1299334 RepID=X8AME8_MYCXE|nr:hypothetical protein I553_2358 [Mycobacterium xenopi 4042]